MTQNPFDSLGGGGFDMNALLQQAQQMQQQLEEAQADLAKQTVEGTVAGGAVTVTANGVGELVGVTIRSGEFDGSDPDDDDIDTSGLAGAELLQQQLGAEVIEEIQHH